MNVNMLIIVCEIEGDQYVLKIWEHAYILSLYITLYFIKYIQLYIYVHACAHACLCQQQSLIAKK